MPKKLFTFLNSRSFSLLSFGFGVGVILFAPFPINIFGFLLVFIYALILRLEK